LTAHPGLQAPGGSSFFIPTPPRQTHTGSVAAVRYLKKGALFTKWHDTHISPVPAIAALIFILHDAAAAVAGTWHLQMEPFYF